MRLDCIVGELAKCSRTEANKYLEAEKVFVNFKEEIRASKKYIRRRLYYNKRKRKI